MNWKQMMKYTMVVQLNTILDEYQDIIEYSEQVKCPKEKKIAFDIPMLKN